MLHPSTAPDLNIDGSTALGRALAQPMILGLFLPLQSGAWSPSTAPRKTDWTFEYNARCAIRAEELEFDLVFGLAQWLGKGGYGGDMRFREMAMDPLLVTCGLSPLTRNILLVSTVHILYGWHPVQLAKLAATIDHMSGGRWGLNMVTGYKPSEFHMFGLPDIEHDLRYEMADEFVTLMKRLWVEDENLTHAGKYWSMTDAFIAPKPVNGCPVLVNAGTSPATIEYAARHSDFIFITSPAGADPARACEALPAHTRNIKERAAANGRQIRTIINPHVICRPTEREARAAVQRILDHRDPIAVENFHRSISGAGGGKSSWTGTSQEMWTIGGNVHVVGTPEQVVECFAALRAAGCDGLQVNFYDFEPDLEYFAEAVLPLMHEVGLRLPKSPAPAR